MARTVLLCMLVGLAAALDVLINAGGPRLPEIGWRADIRKWSPADSSSFKGGGPINDSLGAVYKSHLWANTGNLEYVIPAPVRDVEVALLFAETSAASGPGVRQMVVKINDIAVPEAGVRQGGRAQQTSLSQSRTKCSSPYWYQVLPHGDNGART